MSWFFNVVKFFYKWYNFILPDYHPKVDIDTNFLIQFLPGESLNVLLDLVIKIVILLLINPSRELQLDKWQYETHKISNRYDYIVVGGGTAGCLLANRLSLNKTVLLIEAGEVNNYLNVFPYINSLNVNSKTSGMNWHYRTTPQIYGYEYTGGADRTAYAGGGKGLGGTSQINWQIYSRGFAADYDLWENKYNASGWTYKSILPYMKKSAYVNDYDKSNEILNARYQTLVKPNNPYDNRISVSLADVSYINDNIVEPFIYGGATVTSTQVLADHNTNQLGFSRMQFAVQENGYTGHSGRRFIYPIRSKRWRLLRKGDKRNRNLHILLDTRVEKVNFNDGAATGVTISRKLSFFGKILNLFKKAKAPNDIINVKNEVILTAGVIITPQILTLSGIGPLAELTRLNIEPTKILEGVGQNLHDHQATMPVMVVFPDGKNFSDVSLKQIAEAFNMGKGRFRSQCGVTAIGFDKVTSENLVWIENRPNVEYILYTSSIGTRLAKKLFVTGFGLKETIYDNYYVEAFRGSPNKPTESIFGTATFLHSKTRGNISLDTKSIEDTPKINYYYLKEVEDKETLALGVARLYRIFDLAYSPKGKVNDNVLEGCGEEFKAYKNQTLGPASNTACVRSCSKNLTVTNVTECAQQCWLHHLSDEEVNYRRCYVEKMTSSAWHMGGTARLGNCDDKMAVVDSSLKVCGVKGLRVADASMFPEPVSGHNIATVYAVAEKCADMILPGK